MMSSTYTISGNNLQELPKSMLYDYFSQFGMLSDHIVRAKGPSPRLEKSEYNKVQPASFTIAFRALNKPERALLGILHQVGDVEISCTKQELASGIAERKIFIKYLDKKATAQDITHSLTAFGQIENVHVSMKKDKSMNLGLCNVLFTDKESVSKILIEANVYINNKKVKVEPFKCNSPQAATTGPYVCSTSSKQNSPFSKQNWSAPTLQDKTEKCNFPSPYSDCIRGIKTPKSVFEMPSVTGDQEADIEQSQPVTPLLNRFSSKHTLTRETRDSRDHFETMPRNGDCIPPILNHIRSLDFSLIEEECEDSPRQRMNSQTYQQTPQAIEEVYPLESPIISIHGAGPVQDATALSEKDSFYSVRPTSRKYYKNPRHHQLGIARNHKAENLRFEQTTTTTRSYPHSGYNAVQQYRHF